jgi:hypothetical protein
VVVTALVAAPFALACTLLLVAGVAKARSRPWLAGLELAVGGAALVAHQAAPAVALLYAGFVVVTVRAIRVQRACGCFAGDEPPPRPGHAVLDGALALSAAAVAVGTRTAPIAFAGVLYVGLLAVCTYLGWAVLAL